MNNINFANPWILLIAIPLLVMVIISYVIAIKKDNRTINNTFSFITHIFIVVLLVLTMAKTTYEKVITETNIYVLADVSYSSNNNLDLIDEYIDDLQHNVPKNSKIGIICFGKDYQLLVDLGEDIISVKQSTVDNSSTNICQALEYASTLFKDNVIKRIVIISDGKETNDSNIVSVVNSLTAENIYIDAIYVDNNVTEEIEEVQINQVAYNSSTFKDIVEKVNVIIQASKDTKSIVSLYCDNQVYDEKAIYVNKGYNAITFDLNTKDSGEHLYEIKVTTENDTSLYNNNYMFNQTVTEKTKILFLSSLKEDEIAATELYGQSSDIDFYINTKDIPYTIEDLCVYDEFILSNIDIRTLYNYSQFINSLDTLVSELGKSLVTIGNTYIQNNETDETLSRLSDMLPIKFGNNDQDKKLITIILDISRSMELTGRQKCAKAAAKTIVENLDENVDVMIIPFFGEVGNPVLPTSAKEKEKLIEIINNYEVYQGTFMGAALKYAYNFITDLKYTKNEVVLITDGLPYGEQKGETLLYAKKMKESNYKLSLIHTVISDPETVEFCENIASTGGGQYYFLKDESSVKSLVLDGVLNVLKEVVLDEKQSTVEILKKKDILVNNISELPNINGLYNNSKKSSSTVVLEATYVDSSNNSYKVPLYTYWNYGNGKVSSYASTISGNWVQNWTNNEVSKKVLENITTANKPDSRVDSAFIFDTLTTGTNTQISVKVPSLSSNSIVNISVIYPDKTIENKQMVWYVQNYITNINTDQVGEYNITLSYQIGELNYETNYKFYISYLPEYNSFTLFEASNLYYMVNANGQISEDGKLVLENNNSKVQKYILDFTTIFMIISAILFVFDIIVRKLRWQDIKSLFNFLNKKEYSSIKERRKKNEK